MSQNDKDVHHSDETEIKENIEKLRKDFFEIHKENIDKKEYHEDDLRRLNESDDWLKAFYIKSKKLREDPLKAIRETLSWRKEFKANDLLTMDLPEEARNQSGILLKGKDKKGHQVLLFNVREHIKGKHPHDLLLAYHFEKCYKFNTDRQLVIFFNLNGSGYKNMDMEFLRFIANCIMCYYPCIGVNVIVYKMPFIFEAVWRIVKFWASSAVMDEFVKFTNETTLLEYIDDKELLDAL